MTSLARLIVISSKLMNIPLAAAWTVVLSFFFLVLLLGGTIEELILTHGFDARSY